MGFDTKAFLRDKFTPRSEAVPVPDLAAYFPDPKDAVWTVRGLSGVELGSCNEAAERNKSIGAIVEGLACGQSKGKADAVRELLGVSGNVPQDIAKRIAMFVVGSVEPKADLELAKKICMVYPIEFYQLTTKISALTGQGHVPGKPQGSGKAKK